MIDPALADSGIWTALGLVIGSAIVWITQWISK